jgi:predicted PurR-regulated permease PerM
MTESRLASPANQSQPTAHPAPFFSMDWDAARVARTRAFVYLGIALLIWLLFQIRKALFVFVLASMLAYLLYPLVDAVERRLHRRFRLLAVALPYVLFIGAVVITGFALRAPVRREVTHLIEQTTSPGFKERLAEWAPFGIPVGAQIQEHQSQILAFMPNLSKGLPIAARDLANCIIVPILSFFLLWEGHRVRDALLDLLHIRPEAVEGILRDAHLLMLQYMRALLLLCLATLVCFSIGLSLMHVRYALLLAAVACPMEFVPVIGPLTADITIIGVSAFNGYPNIVGIVAFLLGYRLFKDYVLGPTLMRRSVKLHPLLAIFGVIAGGDINGLPGIFLSVPVLALARLVYYEWRKNRLHPRNSAVSA